MPPHTIDHATLLRQRDRFMMLHGAQGHRRGVVAGCAMSLAVNAAALCVPAFAGCLLHVAVCCACVLHFAHFWAHFKVSARRARCQHMAAPR